MSNINTKLYITPIVNRRRLADGVRKYSQESGYPGKIFRKKFHPRRKKLKKDLQILDALPYDAKEQLRSYLKEMDYKLAKYKAMIHCNF